jgi:hypothetical protein
LKSRSSYASTAASVDRMISMYFMVVVSFVGGPKCPPHSGVERADAGSTSVAEFLSMLPCGGNGPLESPVHCELAPTQGESQS